MAWKVGLTERVATIESSSNMDGSYPATNILDFDASVQARSVDTTGFTIDFDFGEQKVLGSMVFFDFNVSSFQIQISSTTGNDDGVTFGTTIALDKSAVLNPYTNIYSYFLASNVQRRYLRITEGTGHSALDGLGYYRFGYACFSEDLVTPQFTAPFRREVDTGGRAAQAQFHAPHFTKAGGVKEVFVFNGRFDSDDSTERTTLLNIARSPRNNRIIVFDSAVNVSNGIVGKLAGNINTIRNRSNVTTIQGIRIEQI